MATTNYRPQVTLNNLGSKIDTFDQTHATENVVWTATMSHGSLLIADNTEAAEAAAATVVKVIDDPSIIDNDFTVGDTIQVNVATNGNVFNTGALSYSDTDTVTATALTALLAQLNTFKTITNG